MITKIKIGNLKNFTKLHVIDNTIKNHCIELLQMNFAQVWYLSLTALARIVTKANNCNCSPHLITFISSKSNKDTTKEWSFSKQMLWHYNEKAPTVS